MTRMSEVGQLGESEQPAPAPGRNQALAATVLGALSLLPPIYFVIVMFLQVLEPHSYIGMNALVTVPLAPVGAILAGVGLMLCILWLIACLANFALFQPWRALF